MVKKSFVLSGGGCRGFAHIGVVKALQEHGIEPSEISGTSAGALAGAFLANGFTPDEIKDMFKGKFSLNMFAWNGFKMGLISMKKIREFLQKNLRYTTFETLPIPFYVTATNFINGKQRIFHTGNIIDPVLAASSIPVLFPPVFIDNIPYVDGGVSNNLPVEPFSHKKNEIISVYVNPIKLFDPQESMMELLDRAMHLNFREGIERSSEGCYLFIEPTELTKFGLFDIYKATDIVETGYRFTKEMLQGMENNEY